MNYRIAAVFASAMAALTSSVVTASAGLSSTGESTIKFEAQGPAGMKISGTSGGVRAAEADGKIKIVAPTTGFRTGIGLRDKHLKEYLESEKHPEAALVVDRSKIALPSGGPAAGTVTADLTIHGVTRPAHVNYKIARSAQGYQVQGSIDVNTNDFNIKKPCYLGVCVSEAVKIFAEFTVHEQ